MSGATREDAACFGRNRQAAAHLSYDWSSCRLNEGRCVRSCAAAPTSSSTQLIASPSARRSEAGP
jgi:hypothetical protein